MRIISLKKATIADIPALLELEKSVAGTKIYSPTLTKNEWKEELQKSEVYLIEKIMLSLVVFCMKKTITRISISAVWLLTLVFKDRG